MSGFDGAVLCGGGSRRMGRDKALVEIDGRAMAVRVAESLADAGAAGVVAIGGDAAALTTLGISVLADPWPGEGPLGGVVAALDHADEELVAILACDLLQPDAATIRSLVDRLAVGGSDVVIPRVDGRPQWTHGVWRRRVAGVLSAVFSSGERSIVGAVSGLDVDFAVVADAGPFRDADVPDDLRPDP